MKAQAFSIAVCDDIQTEKNDIMEMTKKICDEERIVSDISCFESAENLLAEMTEGTQYDLLLIDVMMPGLDGIEMARNLRSQNENTSIVFISSNREMALQGYEVAAARYLAKPVDPEKLREAVVYCYNQQLKNMEIFLPANGSIKKVAPRDIYCIEIAGRKCRVRQENEEWDTSLSIRELEEMLSGQGFVRCHQSFLVNCRHVRNFRTSSMELSDGCYVPISKHRIKEVRKAFFNYMA